MKTIWTLSLATALTFCAICGFVVWSTRQEAIDQAFRTNTNLVEALSEEISRNFQTYDLSLKGILDALAEPDIAQVSPTIRRMALFDKSAKADYLNRLAILDASGKEVDDSVSLVPLTGNFSDRDYFAVQRDDADQGLYISKPFKSANGWVIALSRRIPGPNGSFGGVVVASLDIDFFSSLFANLHSRPLDTFAVLRSDGTMIMRQPFRLADIGRNRSNTELFRHFSETASGEFQAKSVTDHSRRVFSFRQVRNLPLVISVGSSESAITDAWMHKAALIETMMAALAAGMVALSLCWVRELRRRRLTEKKLETAAKALAVAASTDGLTGIANRRQFDETATNEWKRAIRSGEPLSILVVDVDFFKAYNDTRGHLAGDDALRVVASCIQSTLARPSDFAARYGGEEFALLLPNTAARGALQVAETIRGKIAESDIHHPGGLGNRMSVSIGITTVSPRNGDSFAAAFVAADEALFRAKRLGRDQAAHSDGTLLSAETHLRPVASRTDVPSARTVH